MRVGVRVRPAFRHEVLLGEGRRSGGYRPAVTVSNEISRARVRKCTANGGENQAQVEEVPEEKLERESDTLAVRQSYLELRMPNGRRRRFLFDYAFDAACGQREVYQR